MTKSSKLILNGVLLIAIMVAHVNGQVITTFGSNGANSFSASSSDFTDTQTASTFEISGNDNGSQLFGTIGTSVIIGNPSALLLTASYSSASAASSNFQIVLFDSSFNSRTYQANLSSFTPRNSNVGILLNLSSQSGGFNGTVDSLQFLTAGGPPGASLDLTMSQLSAAPEPSTYALLIIGSLAIVGGARALRKAQVSA